MNEIPDIKCQNDPARVPSVRVRLGTTYLPATPGIAWIISIWDIEISKFSIFELWIWEKDQNATNPRHESIFFFSAVVQLGLPSIFSDEILRNHNETTFW